MPLRIVVLHLRGHRETWRCCRHLRTLLRRACAAVLRRPRLEAPPISPTPLHAWMPLSIVVLESREQRDTSLVLQRPAARAWKRLPSPHIPCTAEGWAIIRQFYRAPTSNGRGTGARPFTLVYLWKNPMSPNASDKTQCKRCASLTQPGLRLYGSGTCDNGLYRQPFKYARLTMSGLP